MVTGDHAITATAIAQQIGLTGSGVSRWPIESPQFSAHELQKNDDDPDWEVIKGEQISSLTEADWDRLIAKKNLVFARTTPQHKHLIVTEYEKRNQIIAMTGDGVNDAPALKKCVIKSVAFAT